MNVADIPVRATVLLASGDQAEVLAINDATETVRIRYLDAFGEPGLVGTETWVSVDEVIAIDTGSHIEGTT